MALAYYNKEQNPEKARRELETAYKMDETDSRVLMELDQLYKKTGVPAKKRLEILSKHMEQVEDRDDLMVEYITLLNITGAYEEALRLAETRQFHPWEGGEGKIPKQYVNCFGSVSKKGFESRRE